MQINESPFVRWATPKLRPLAQARFKDIRLQHSLPINFLELLRYYMAEYEGQPFAQPRFTGNIASGVFGFTADALRLSAEEFFRHHSHPDRLGLLTIYEISGNISEDSPLDPTTAPELWAAMEQPRIRWITRSELGIPPTTLTPQLPINFYTQRKIVIEREFRLLSQEEQSDWYALAHMCKSARDRGETDLGAVQDLQATIPGWILNTMLEKLTDSALGDFVVQWSGFYLAPQDNSLQHFHGQVTTQGSVGCWFDMPQYVQHVESVWKGFAENHVNGSMIPKLPKLSHDICDRDISGYRDEMEVFLERLFKVVCKLEYLDRVAFWDLVAARPHDFVSPKRLPDGVTFDNPHNMSNTAFRAFYAHIWLCFEDRNSVDAASRFVYDLDVINLYIGLNQARKLKARWDAKKREVRDSATAAAAEAITAAQAEAAGAIAENKAFAANAAGVCTTGDRAADGAAAGIGIAGINGGPPIGHSAGRGKVGESGWAVRVEQNVTAARASCTGAPRAEE